MKHDPSKLSGMTRAQRALWVAKQPRDGGMPIVGLRQPPELGGLIAFIGLGTIILYAFFGVHK